MADMQFEVLTDLTVMNPNKIDTNFEAVKGWLQEAIAPYTTMAVTDETAAEAKKQLASIRKLKTSINDQKIAVKKQWMQPYTSYENQVKELLGICDSGIDNLNGQIKEAEEAAKAQKMEELKEFFESEVGDMSPYLEWRDIVNPRWANVTYKADTIHEEITERISHTREDIGFIRASESDFQTAMLDEYCRSHDIRNALEKGKQLKALREAEERRKAEAHERALRESRKAAESVPEPQEASESAPDDAVPEYFVPYVQPEPEVHHEKIYTLHFEVKVNLAQAKALKNFFVDSGIDYKKI